MRRTDKLELGHGKRWIATVVLAALGTPLTLSAATSPNISLTPGVMTTYAGSTSNGGGGLGNGGAATSATLFNPAAARFDAAGNLYILDAGNMFIRKVIAPGLTGAGTIVAFAGTGIAGSGGDGGQAVGASFSANARGLFVTASGVVYLSDSGNNAVRRIDTTGKITTVAGTNGAVAGYTGDGGQATAATLNNPGGIYVDAAGNLYIADTGNNAVRVVNTSGVISTFAGGTGVVCAKPTDTVGDGCPIAQSALLAPADVWGDAAGNLDILDAGDFRIRKANATTGLITSIVGTGAKGTSGDGAAATSATFGAGALGITIDSTGNLFLADTGNSKVRMVNLAGIISTVAGNGTAGSPGDGVSAIAANLNLPSGITVDATNNLYISDTQNSRIREVLVNAGILTLSNSVVSAASTTSIVTVMNTGTTAMTITGIAITAPFAEKTGVATDCKTTTSLASGATCTLTLMYTPTAAGYVTGNATLQTNAANVTSGSAVIQLYGQGITAGTTASTTVLTTSFTGVPSTTSGQSVTLTATVSGTGAAAPSGSVVFTSGVTVLGTVALTASTATSSTASLTTTSLMMGIDSVVATYTGDATFKASASAAQIIGVYSGPMDFGITANVSSLTVANGSSGVVTLNVYSLGGYANTVGFQCVGLPPSATCNFTPFTTFVQAGKQSNPNIAVTISFPPLLSSKQGRGPWRSTGEIALAFTLCGGFLLKRRKRMAIPTLLLALMSGFGLASLSGCSSAPKQAPFTGTYNIQIVASDGTISHSVTVPVTVQ